MRVRCAYGKINTAWNIFLASVAVFGVLAWMLWEPESKSNAGDALIVYCAPAVKVPAEAVAQEYERAYGTKIQFQFGQSGTLLGQVEIAHKGDVFLPADDSYNDLANSKNLIAEMFPIAKMHGQIVVRKGNPKKIQALADLSRPDVKVTLAGEAAAIGKLTRLELEKQNLWEPLAKKAISSGAVTEVATAVTTGAADAGVIWNSMLGQYPALESVDDPAISAVHASVSAAILRSSKNPTAALHFARYLAAQDKGLQQFKKAGYDVAAGDAWVDHPELKLFAGAMLKPAIEKTIAEFEAREGARVTCVYNGCGILVSQMRAAQGTAMPDAYFACDRSFMTQVADLFLDAEDVSQNQLAILVPKGNPHGIKQLKDLGKPGLRVGVGHEKQCALGALTATAFKTGGVFDGVMKNVKVQLPTGDGLVNQVLTGALDAVVAYISNASSSKDKLDAIAIDIPCALAVQPMALSKDSHNRQIAARLMQALQSAESRERFETQGFTWKAKEANDKR